MYTHAVDKHNLKNNNFTERLSGFRTLSRGRIISWRKMASKSGEKGWKKADSTALAMVNFGYIKFRRRTVSNHGNICWKFVLTGSPDDGEAPSDVARIFSKQRGYRIGLSLISRFTPKRSNARRNGRLFRRGIRFQSTPVDSPWKGSPYPLLPLRNWILFQRVPTSYSITSVFKIFRDTANPCKFPRSETSSTKYRSPWQLFWVNWN